MKRVVWVIFLITSALTSKAQSLEFDSLLQKGKDEFQKDFTDQDYQSAVIYLEKAVALYPESQEAHYFLGNAYKRLNSKDATGMIDMSLDLTLKCSNEIETVISLDSN